MSEISFEVTRSGNEFIDIGQSHVQNGICWIFESVVNIQSLVAEDFYNLFNSSIMYISKISKVLRWFANWQQTSHIQFFPGKSSVKVPQEELILPDF